MGDLKLWMVNTAKASQDRIMQSAALHQDRIRVPQAALLQDLTARTVTLLCVTHAWSSWKVCCLRLLGTFRGTVHGVLLCALAVVAPVLQLQHLPAMKPSSRLRPHGSPAHLDSADCCTSRRLQASYDQQKTMALHIRNNVWPGTSSSTRTSALRSVLYKDPFLVRTPEALHAIGEAQLVMVRISARTVMARSLAPFLELTDSTLSAA